MYSPYYPPGCSDRLEYFLVELVCPWCKHKWEADAYEQFGMAGLVDDDKYQCPICGTWND